MPADEPTAPRGSAADRLDLDDLGPLVDLDSAVDLDVVGDDGPTASQRMGAWLEGRGITPFVRRHRAATAVVAVAVVALAGLGLWWRVARPVPLPDQPRVVASVAEVGPELAETSPDGQATQVQQAIDLAVTEDPGTVVAVLGITGPGLGQVAGLPIVVADSENPDRPVLARGSLSCGDTTKTADLSRARDIDYRVVVRRSAPGGTASVDSVDLVGGQRLLDLVRSTCLQRAADRELRITGATVTRVEGPAIALRVAMTVEAVGAEPWSSVRVSPAAQPTFVGLGAPLDVAPGHPTTVLGELRPRDCLEATSGLELGTLLSASPPGSAEGTVPPAVLVALPDSVVHTLSNEVHALCGDIVASAVVTTAIMRTGSAPGTGGTLDLEVALSVPGASTLELTESVSAAGRLAPQATTLGVVRGTARTHAIWLMPPCAALVDVGLPRLTVSAVSRDSDRMVQRPYLVPLGGDALGVALTRLCPDVAPEIRLPG